jgi:hypothetical protein
MAKKDKVYSISIVNKKHKCGDFPQEQVFVGEDICLKKRSPERLTQASQASSCTVQF